MGSRHCRRWRSEGITERDGALDRRRGGGVGMPVENTRWRDDLHCV